MGLARVWGGRGDVGGWGAESKKGAKEIHKTKILHELSPVSLRLSARVLKTKINNKTFDELITCVTYKRTYILYGKYTRSQPSHALAGLVILID